MECRLWIFVIPKKCRISAWTPGNAHLYSRHNSSMEISRRDRPPLAFSGVHADIRISLWQNHNLHSMSNMKYRCIVKRAALESVDRIPFPAELIPADASKVEIEAKKLRYFNAGDQKSEKNWSSCRRPIDDKSTHITARTSTVPLWPSSECGEIFKLTPGRGYAFSIVSPRNSIPWCTMLWSDSSPTIHLWKFPSSPAGAFSRSRIDLFNGFGEGKFSGLDPYRKNSRTKLDFGDHLFLLTARCWQYLSYKEPFPCRYFNALRFGLASFIFYGRPSFLTLRPKRSGDGPGVCKICLSLNCSRHFRSAMRIPYRCEGRLTGSALGPHPSEEDFSQGRRWFCDYLHMVWQKRTARTLYVRAWGEEILARKIQVSE